MKLLLVDTAPPNCCPSSPCPLLEKEWIDEVLHAGSPDTRRLASLIGKTHGLRPRMLRCLQDSQTSSPTLIISKLRKYPGNIAVIPEPQTLLALTTMLSNDNSLPASEVACLRKA